MESPYNDPAYGTASFRALRGGSYIFFNDISLASHYRIQSVTYAGEINVGFRVASEVPEPATIALLGLGGLHVARRRR